MRHNLTVLAQLFAGLVFELRLYIITRHGAAAQVLSIDANSGQLTSADASAVALGPVQQMTELGGDGRGDDLMVHFHMVEGTTARLRSFLIGSISGFEKATVLDRDPLTGHLAGSAHVFTSPSIGGTGGSATPVVAPHVTHTLSTGTLALTRQQSQTVFFDFSASSISLLLPSNPLDGDLVELFPFDGLDQFEHGDDLAPNSLTINSVQDIDGEGSTVTLTNVARLRLRYLQNAASWQL